MEEELRHTRLQWTNIDYDPALILNFARLDALLYMGMHVHVHGGMLHVACRHST